MVYAKTMQGLTWEGIENQIKIDANELDADTVAIIHDGSNGYKAGKAFKCN